MYNDLATLNGLPRLTLVVDGERFAVHPLSLADLGEMQSWVDAQHADPIDLVRAKLGQGLSMAQEQFLLRTALEIAARPRALIGTPEADALLMSAAGQKQMLWRSIRKGDPAFTEADADRLFGRLTPAELGRALREIGAEAVASDPKAPAGDGPAEPPREKRTRPSTGGSSTTSA